MKELGDFISLAAGQGIISCRKRIMVQCNTERKCKLRLENKSLPTTNTYTNNNNNLILLLIVGDNFIGNRVCASKRWAGHQLLLQGYGDNALHTLH